MNDHEARLQIATTLLAARYQNLVGQTVPVKSTEFERTLQDAQLLIDLNRSFESAGDAPMPFSV